MMAIFYHYGHYEQQRWSIKMFSSSGTGQRVLKMSHDKQGLLQNLILSQNINATENAMQLKTTKNLQGNQSQASHQDACLWKASGNLASSQQACMISKEENKDQTQKSVGTWPTMSNSLSPYARHILAHLIRDSSSGNTMVPGRMRRIRWIM